MIIQTAPAGKARLAIMMHEHTAVSGQFARTFGNDQFEPVRPSELMVYAVSHHDAGWAEFDRDPVTDTATGLPYNLVDTPAKYVTITSRGSPDFNQRHHPYCGLLSSMHSWGLYNGRYGLSNQVLIDRFSEQHRPLVQRMLVGELARQDRLKAELAKISRRRHGSRKNICFRITSSFNSLICWRSISTASTRTNAASRHSDMCRSTPNATRASPSDRASPASMRCPRFHLPPTAPSSPLPDVSSSRASMKPPAVGRPCYGTRRPDGRIFVWSPRDCRSRRRACHAVAAGAHEPAGQRAGCFAALENRLTRDQRHLIAVDALHEPAAACRHVVHELGLVQPQLAVIDDIHIRAQPGRQAAAVGKPEEIGGLAGLPLDHELPRQARPALPVAHPVGQHEARQPRIDN